MRFLLLALCLSFGLSAHAGYMIETVIKLDGNFDSSPAFVFNNATLRHTIEVTDSMVYANQIEVPNGPPLPQPPFGFEVYPNLYGHLGKTKLQISGALAPGIDGIYETGELVVQPNIGRLYDRSLSPLMAEFFVGRGFFVQPDLSALTPEPIWLNLAPGVTHAIPYPSVGDPIEPFSFHGAHVWLGDFHFFGLDDYAYQSTIISSRVIGITTPEPSSILIFAALTALGCCYRRSRRPKMHSAC